MKARTCPHCGYKYTLTDHTKEYFKLGEETFVCKNCNTDLAYIRKRRYKFISMTPTLFGYPLVLLTQEFYDISFGLGVLLYFVFSAASFFIASTFITYRTVNIITREKH